MKMRLFLIVSALVLLMCLVSQNCFAGGDPCVYKSSHSDTEGNSTSSFTNRDAQNMNKYIRTTRNGGYEYKNYSRLTPNSSKTLPCPSQPSPCTLNAPYSRLDVTYNANNNRSLPSIVVPYYGTAGGSIDISPIIMRESMRYNVDPVLVMTVIKFESGFCPSAVSPAGACGLMQLMPGTASALGVSDVFSPFDNISGGVQYIRRQLDNFGGNVALALAAYNAGPGAVFAYGGIPPFAETQNYVFLILNDYLSAARVAKRQGGSTTVSMGGRSKSVDVISTLSKMKDQTPGNTPENRQKTAAAPENATQTLLPISGGSSSSPNLLENRSYIQGSPLENKPTATVPGF